MQTAKGAWHNAKIPGRFSGLVRKMPPHAIANDADHADTIEIIDRLMAIPRLTKDQEKYLETLVQLVQAYEASRHAIDTSSIRPLDMLKHLLSENEMTAADLARLLGVHPSMGSKILNGDRSLTIDHVRRLADRFRISPELFIG